MKSMGKCFKTHNLGILNTMLFVLGFCFCCLMGSILLNKESLETKAENYGDNFVVKNFEYLSTLERDYREENPDQTAEEVIAFLEDQIFELNKSGRMNCQTKCNTLRDFQGTNLVVSGNAKLSWARRL